jgi:hypothetical protein
MSDQFLYRRREFITLIGSAAAAWPLAARAQQPEPMRRIAVLMGTAPTKQYETYLAAFLRQLDKFGWKEAHNTHTEVRWWAGGPQQMRPVVAELLAFSPDVMMVYSNLALAVLRPMAGKIPVVFNGIGDPVGDGFVTSLAHPGGNMTGFTGYDGPMGGKWLEVLRETAPHLSRVLAVFHPETPGTSPSRRARGSCACAATCTTTRMRRKAGTRRPSACSSFRSRSTGAERRAGGVCRRPQSHLIGDAIASARVIPVHQVGIYAGRILKDAFRPAGASTDEI